MKRPLLLCFGMLLALGPPLWARDKQEPNNTIEKATKVASGKVLEASIHPAKDIDYFAVDVPAPGIGYLDVTVREVPAEIAPLVQILGPDKKELTKGQSPAGSPLFRRQDLKAGGTYYVSLRNGGFGQTADRASKQPMRVLIRYVAINQAFEPNNELKQAAALSFGKAVQASLYPAADLDYYKVAVPEPGHGLVTIRLADLPAGLRPGIWLRDPNSKSKVTQWRRTGRGATVFIHAHAPGDLVFLVSTRSPQHSSGYVRSRRRAAASPYTLRVDYEASGDASEPNDDAKSATSLSLGEAKSAVLFPRGDRDFYKIEVPKPGRGRLDVVVRGLADSIAPRLHLYGPDGKELERSARRRGTELYYQRELIAHGTYALHLQDGSASGSGYYDSDDDAWSRKPYTVQATFTPAADAHEPNDTHDTAEAVELNKPVQATIFPVGDSDFYKFTIPPTTHGVVRVRVEGLNDKMVAGLHLFDAAKKRVHRAAGAPSRAAVLTRCLRAGDYFVQVHDADFRHGRAHLGSNDSSSLEPYTLTVAFEPVPGADGEPNGKIEQATPLTLSQPAKGTLFPGDDSDFYKIDLQPGTVRIQVGDFGPDIRARVNLLGPNKRLMVYADHHAPRAFFDVKIAKAGTHYVQVHPVRFDRAGHAFHSAEQFDPSPYSVLVAPAPAQPPAGAAEQEPNADIYTAQALPPGQTVLGTIAKPEDRDWFKVAVGGPSHLVVDMPEVPPEINAHLSVYHLANAAQPQPKNVLYLRDHGEYNLHHRCPDARMTLVECNSPQGKAAFANTALMQRYDAIVVDLLTDPNRIDLNSPRVQANITSYVQGGGRFILLAPVFPLKLFGVELAEPNKWHQDAVVDLGTQHPLLAGIETRRVRGWHGSESAGYFKGWREAGFQMLFAHASDPEQHAVTIAKQVGRGWLVLDTQSVGYYRHWPVADWKFRAYLGIPQMTLLGYFNDTLKHSRERSEGAKELARLRVWEPGTCFIGVSASPRQASQKPYALSATLTPIAAPPPAESTLETARKLELGQDGKAEATIALSGKRGRAWYRFEGREASELSIVLSDVAHNADPQITIHESLLGKAKLPKRKRVLYLHGERGDFHLDRHFPDIEFERIEWNDARAMAILLRLDDFKTFDAVVVDAVTRPHEFSINRETVARNIEAYAQQGGRFVVLSPLCQVKLFGVENAEWQNWHQNNVRPVYPAHALLASRTRRDRLNGWPHAEAVGYWRHGPGSGFQPLAVDWRDVHRFAVTLAKQVGQGWIILDSQPLGQHNNFEAGGWKLYTYLGTKPFLRQVGLYDKTEAAAMGGGERCHLETKATTYLVEVANRAPSGVLRAMKLRVESSSAERPLEPDDAPQLAKPVAPGQDSQATFYPRDDEDWREVAAAGRGLLSARVTGLADNIDPTVWVRRKVAVAKPLRVLYLEGNPANEIDASRFEGVAITRIDAHEPKAGKALDDLANHDVVVVSCLSDARQFGLHRKESHEKLRRFVEGGGKCVVLRPYGLSFAENCPQMGGVLEQASSQRDGGAWHAAHASDGYKIPGQQGTGWCCGRQAKPPHKLTWSFGGASRRLDRLVLYNHATSPDRRAKEVEVLAGDGPEALRSVGKFTAADSDERQVFRFPALSCKFVQLAIVSNYGHKTETQVGEVEFYGPDSLEGFFGVPLVGGSHSSAQAADPLHWIANRRYHGRADGWGGDENAGWWMGWREQGWHLVYASRDDPRRRGVTLVKRLGKGWVALDAQSLTHPPFADKAAWKLHNYLDAARAEVGRFDGTQQPLPGAAETVGLPVTEKGQYLVRLADSPGRDAMGNSSGRRYTFAAGFRPEDSEYEPSDTPAKATRLSSDEPVEECLFPGGDVDWFKVAVERPSLVTVDLDSVPTGVDPAVELHRASLGAKPVKVLYLACRLPHSHGAPRRQGIDERNWGPAPVTFTRIDAGTPAEATAMDRLAGHDVVLLDRLDDARRFGMHRKETWDKIHRYAEGGGRFIVAGALGYSLSLLARESGASIEAWSEGACYSRGDALRLCDGWWHASSTGWATRGKGKFPHWLLFRLGGATPPTVDRLVVYNTASSRRSYEQKRRAKQIELQIAGPLPAGKTALDALTFRSVGKFECKPIDERQEFSFQATSARYVKVLFHSSHGDPRYVSLGELELYGPKQPEGLFGLRHVRASMSGSVVVAKPDHWIVGGPGKKRTGNWGGPPVHGYYEGLNDSGFEAVLALRVYRRRSTPIRRTPQPTKPGTKTAPAKKPTTKTAPAAPTRRQPQADDRAITLCKAVGKGFIVVDAQDLGAPGQEAAAARKLHHYLGLTPTRLATFNDTLAQRKGGAEHIEFAADPGLYYLRVTDAQAESRRAQGQAKAVHLAPWSLEKLRLSLSVEPVERSFEPNDAPEQATWLVNGLPVRSALYPAGDADWFRVSLPKATPVVFEVVEVPADLDPVVQVYAAGKFDSSLRSSYGSRGGGAGCPVLFAFKPRAAGDYYFKVGSGGYSSAATSPEAFTIRALFDDGKKAAAPRIVATWPPAGLRSASLAPEVIVQFDRPMSPRGIDGAVVVRGAKSGTMRGKLAYDPSRYQAVFTPSGTFGPSEQVTVSVRSGLSGIYGGKLAKGAEWAFTTMSLTAGGKPATVRLALAGGSMVGVGEAAVTLRPSRRLRGTPTLTAKAKGASVPVADLRKGERGTWTAKLTVRPTTPNGEAIFEFKGIDSRGLPVVEITEGRTFTIDTQPPPAMAGLTATPAAQGKARLTWKRPAGVPDLGGYRLYRCERDSSRVEGATVVKTVAGADFLTWDDPTPRDGKWFYFVAAVDRAGNVGKPSATTSVATDRVGPKQAVAEVTAKVVEKPRIDIAWKATAEADIVGYSVFRFVKEEKEGEALPSLYEAEPLTEVPRDRLTLQDFPKDNAYVYVVAARDPAGNLSPASKPAEVVLDTRRADASIELSAKSPLTQGDHTLTVKLSEPLGSELELALKLPGNTLRKLAPAKKDDLTYEAKMTFTEKDIEGWVSIRINGEDRYGNKGIRIVRTSGFNIDTGPPKARVDTTRSGRVPAGKTPVRVEFYEQVQDAAKLWCTVGEQRIDVPIKRQRRQTFVGELVVKPDFPNGKALWHIEATDNYKHTGGVVIRGKEFTIDTKPPEPPLNVAVKPGRGRALIVTWAPPTAEPIAHFRLYGATSQDVKPSKETLLADNVRGAEATHKPKENQILWFVVVAVDRAGNESAPSKIVKGVPDITPPPPATNLTVKLGDDARVHLAWTPPQADEPITYNVYRLAEAATSVEGRKPVVQAKDATAIDDPKKDGVFHYLVTAVDEAGNESPPVVAQPLDYDVNPPTATVELAPTEGKRGWRESFYVHYVIGVLAAGEKTVTLTPSEKLAEPPTLRYRSKTMDTPKEIALTEANGKWQGKITIPETTDDGKLLFFFQGVDLKQNRGDVISKGKGNLFWVDTTPPEAVQSLQVTSLPVGKVALEWGPPPGDRYDTVRYRVYRHTEAFREIGDLKPLKADLDKPKLTDEPPNDGTYHYAIVAVDQAGNVGKLHQSTPAVSDGTPPKAPTNLKATVKGEIVLAWEAEADERLEYRVLRNGETVADHLAERAFRDAPEQNGSYDYRVVATDAAGNVSKESASAKVEFVNTLPVATIVTEPKSPVRSAFRVVLTSSQPLGAPPELFLHLARGKPLRVPVEARDGKWVGSVQVTKETPNGEARFTFQGTSKEGHRGWRIRSGAKVVIDTVAPSASIVLRPRSPLKAGRVQVTLKPAEPLKEAPKLSYVTMGANAREIAVTKQEDHYVAEVEITDQDNDGVGFFSYSGIDLAGNVGTTLRGARFEIDSHPPKPPTKLAARPIARGYVELAWVPPVYGATETPDQIVGYNVYASSEEIKEVGELQPLRKPVTRIPAKVYPPAGGTFFFAVTTVDATGFESAPSNCVSCSSTRGGVPAPRITLSEARPATIELAWEADELAKAFAVLARVPGEERDRRVAEKVEGKSFSYRPLRGGRYVIRVQSIDQFGGRGAVSAPAVVEFTQNAPIASLRLSSERLGYGAFAVAMETTRPLIRAPKLRLVPDASPPIDITVQGAAQAWQGQFQIDKNVKGKAARFEYEGVASVGGREVTGTGIMAGASVILDFAAPTAAIEFVDRVFARDRKVIVRAGRLRFRVKASEPLAADPKVTFTPRGKATQTCELSKRSDTEWGGVLVVGDDVGDGVGMFEAQLVDRQGNKGDEITANRIVDIDTTPPNPIKKIRAVSLPGGKVRVDWIPPYSDDGKLDKEANTFHLYRSESEVKDITGLTPHRVVQRVLGLIDRPPADRDYYYAVAAVDDAGNIGTVSKSARVHVDKTPPGKPREFRVKQTETGVVHLSWKPPEGEKPLFYNVYLAKHPILTTKGMTPRNPGVTWTEIYGTPNENGTYYFAVTAVDPVLNESEPCESVMLDYKTIAPFARFFLEPDIWLHNGEYRVTLRTSKALVEPPQVTIKSEHDKTYPLPFEGAGSEWRATLKIDDSYPEGTYGFIYRGKDAEGNTGDEIQRGPLFHVDKTPPLSPGKLAIKPDDLGTPGAVVLTWRTPKKEGEKTEVPHFYNIYRSEKEPNGIEGMTHVHTFKVVYENLDEYKYTDMPPANGTYYYVVTSLDMARNESAPSNVFKVTVQSDSPRATLEFYALIDGKASPVPTNEEQRPVLGKGKTRVVLTTTSPLAAAPKLAWRFLRGDEDTRHPVTLTGSGTKWEGVLEADFELDVIRAAAFEFEGTSEGGSKGTFIRKGGKVRFDTEGPPAEIVIPDAYKMLVNVKTNKLDAPPVHGGRVAVKLTTREDLARPPKLTYTLDDGKPVPVPMTGFGRSWQGWMDIPVDAPSHNGRFQYEGMDRAGNVTTSIAKRRYPYEDDGNFPIPRKIASYATTGGEFVTDTVAPEQPTNVETEMRKLGIAVIKWKEPPGEPWTYNLYRSLTPISSTEGLKPIKTQIYATIMVDDPPVDGKYYYAVTAIDMAKNESPLSENSSVFIDSIKPELKIKAVPQGDDFVILMDENAPPQLSLTINFPGQKSMRVELGGTSGELEEYTVKTLPSGQRAIVLPQKVGLFNGKVEIVVHSPDPDGNIVEEKTETEYKKIATATGGEVESADEQVQLVIPPGVEPVIPKGPNETKRIGGYENLFFIQYANIPDKKPKTEPGERRRRDQVDPIPPGLEVVGVPYRIELNQPPEEPLQLKAAATQADLSQLKSLTAKLKMKIPTQYSDAVEDVEYLQGRLKVIKWVPARSNEDADKGHWEPVPDIELDVKNKQIITPATDITTYVIVSERTPPSIRDMVPERGGSVTTFRPEISCLIVDKGTGVAVGAENRIVLSIDGKKVDEKLLSISKGDPTEVSVTYKPPEDLKAGTHIVGVRAEDVVENVANVKWQFTIDNEPPEFIRVSPAEGERLPVARPLIQARIEDEGGIAPGRAELSIDGAAIPGSYVTWHEGAGLLTCTLPDDLASGTHQALLVVYDKAGTSAEKAWSFRVDLEPPTVAKLSPAPDSQVAPDTAQVAFRAQDLFGRLEILSFRVDGNRIPMAERKDDTGYRFDPKTGELSYAAPKPFALGDHQVSVLYADDLGNAATRTWSFRSKQGAPAAVAWDQPVKTPEFETVRSSYETVAVRVDTTRLEEYAPQAVEEVSTLVEQAEELAVDSKFEQSAAKYAQAATKLADADNKATEAEHKEVVEANTARLDAAKKAYAASADNAGLERVKKHAPETLSTIGKLVKEADKLAAEGKLEQGRENYYAAAALLDDASKAVEEAERASVAREAAKRLAAAREKYAEAASEVDRGLLEKHTPEALPAATRLVREADDLASEEKLAEAEAKYTQAIATLADASKKADGLEQAAAAAAAAARHEQAKGRYADIAARANRPRVQKHVPDALPAVDELAKEAEALAGANKLDQSAAKFREAADRLLAADTKAEQLERKERFGELAQQHEAAKRKYNELAASANATHIDRHVPGAMAGVRRLVQEAEALAAEQKLAESLQKYTQAQAALAAAQAKAQQLARGDDTAVRARYEAAKKRCTDLAAAVNRERLRKHVPEAAAAVSRLLQQAMALARENRLAESAARYEEITQKLTAADAKAKELERGVATPPGPQPHEAARQKLLDLATKVDTERVSKHVPQAMPQVAELARQAKALAAEGKLAESAAKYTEACDTLTAADAKAQELERAATTATATAGAQLQAAKARYVEVARSVDARRVAKHLPNAFPAVQRLLDEAETLARAGKPQEGAGKYAEATNQLLAADRKAEQMERAAAAPAVDAQEEFRKARDRYTKLAGSVDAPRITKHLPNVFPTVQRLLNEAGALGQQGKLREGAAKLNQAADLLADSERKAQQLERGPAVAAGDAKQQYESARERYMKVAGSVDAKQIAKHLPDVFPTVRRLLAEAGTLSQAGKLHEGATKLTQAADLLDNAHSRASTMDPVVQEMQVIDTLLKEGKAQEALPRICKPLLDLWTKHRRSRWAELLEWVRQRRETYKPLALTGRNQLDVLEKTLQGYVREERAWTSMQKQLAGLPDLKARIRRVESYLNYNYGSVYYSDGQTLLHTLRVELLRQQEKNK